MALMVVFACGCGDEDDEDDDDSFDQQKCDQLVDVATECFDSFCASSSVAFCGCWNNGQDINVSTCECAPLDLEVACQQVDLENFDPSQYNCSAATTIVSDFCN
jgi:hypothetical protein